VQRSPAGAFVIAVPAETSKRRLQAGDGCQYLSIGRSGHAEIVSQDIDWNPSRSPGRHIDHGRIEEPRVRRLKSD
jgi:hypothetical protein